MYEVRFSNGDRLDAVFTLGEAKGEAAELAFDGEAWAVVDGAGRVVAERKGIMEDVRTIPDEKRTPPRVAATRPDFTADDGYGFAAALDCLDGYQAVSSWGEDGWDAGDWPLVVFGRSLGARSDVFPKAPSPLWIVIEYCEGDIAVNGYHSEAEQLAALNESIFWGWRRCAGFTGSGPADFGDFEEGFEPVEFRGLFSWERCRAGGEVADGLEAAGVAS